ncbi:hypothetical protein [Bradymonas sediminis]|uniref:hypothetical protein n=1 Tax=Bradymonas sediminis TaxID=1548548 RepID=UPI0010E09297|nr:hypothetical protein [Bradymonas sediminis]TDP77193.1 hypothetical protein DFR33_10190 [Bradymonas sediminis]
MEHRTFDYLNSRQLPTGRRIFALKAMRRVAEGLGEAAIVARCDRAIAADEACLRMEMTYRQGKSFATTARGGAAELDREIDAVWAGVHAVAQGQAVGEDAVAEQASAFLKEVFPEGLAGLVKLSFEAQLAHQELLLERFDPNTGDLGAQVDALGVRRHVEHLNFLVPRFRAELERENAAKVTFEQVKRARRDCLDQFAGAVFAVLTTFDTDSAEHAERRAACLAEFHRQNASVVEAYRRQSKVEDVNPETGEPVAEPEAEPIAEADAPAPAAADPIT